MSETQDRYPVYYSLQRSLYRKFLFDVDGRIVRGAFGEPINLYSPAVRDYITSGHVRFIYDIPNEYRYIVISEEQYYRFQKERVIGSTQRGKTYYVYPDDDATSLLKNSTIYRPRPPLVPALNMRLPKISRILRL